MKSMNQQASHSIAKFKTTKIKVSSVISLVVSNKDNTPRAKFQAKLLLCAILIFAKHKKLNSWLNVACVKA